MDPSNVRALPEYDEETKSFLAPTESAFSLAYNGIRAIWNARDAAARNPGWTEEQRILQLSKLADKKMGEIAKTFDSVRANLVKQIDYIEGELSVPVEAKSGTRFAVEIRAHAKALSLTERQSFIRAAILEGDETTMSALLGAPAYLSGLNNEFQRVFLRQWHEKVAPEKTKRLTALLAAKTLIEERGGLVFPGIEKAMGASWGRVAELRKAQDTATKALELT